MVTTRYLTVHLLSVILTVTNRVVIGLEGVVTVNLIVYVMIV